MKQRNLNGACSQAFFVAALTLFLSVGVGTANSAPSQPTFNSVPSVARMYPYTYPSPACGPYTVVVDYTDPNGASDLQHVYLQIKGDGAAQTIMYSNMTTAQQWWEEGDHLHNITASKSSIANGYQVTFRFQIKNTWTPSKNVDFEAWALDKSNAKSSPRLYDWNGIYDNNLRIAGVRKVNLVDNDGNGYYSSVRIEADANTSVSSRNIKMILYQRDSAAGGNGIGIYNTGNYTISGTATDYKGTDVTVTTKGIHDFAWELYDADADWFIDRRWYVDADISNIPMEPISGRTLQPGNGIWIKLDPDYGSVVGNEQKTVENLVNKQIKHIFLVHHNASADQWALYTHIIQQAHAQDLTVHAVCYSPKNGTIPGPSDIKDAIEKVLTYNSSHPTAAFDGGQVDIEGITEQQLLDALKEQLPASSPTLVFSAAVDDMITLNYYDKLLNTRLDLLIPMLYVMDSQSYNDGSPLFGINLETIKTRTGDILSHFKTLGTKGQLMVGVSSFDREILVPFSFTGRTWLLEEDVDFFSRLAYDPSNPYGVPTVASDSDPSQWKIYYDNSTGVSVYRFPYDSSRNLDIVETTPSGLRRAILAAKDGADDAEGSAKYVGACVWVYHTTFDQYSLREEGLTSDDLNYPQPLATVELIGYDGGLARLRVSLTNGDPTTENPKEPILGSHAGAGVHLRLDSGAVFQSADRGSFHDAEAFNESAIKIPTINGATIVELRRSFFERPDSSSQIATSGEIRVAATGGFTLRYRSWMYDKDSICEDGGTPEPYIARSPNDIHYHDPSRFLLYKILTAVFSPPAITTNSPLPSGTVSSAYSQTLQATGGSMLYSWTVVSGSLPPGLGLSSSTGVISGTPTTANPYNFWIRVTDSNSLYSEKDFSLTINPCQTLSAPTLISPSGSGISTTPTLNWSDVSGFTSYDVQVCSDNNCNTVVQSQSALTSSQWAVPSALDQGTNYWWRARANNACGPGAWPTNPLSFTTVSPPGITTSSPLPSGTVSTAYSQTLEATGGSKPYGWTIASGSLPPGLSLASTTGLISGTLTTANTYNFRIRVTDSNSLYSEKDFSLTIDPVGITRPAPPTNLRIVGGAGGIRLAWNPNQEEDLSGYKLYYGLSPWSFGDPVKVGKKNSYILEENLVKGQRYYIALTAYDRGKHESFFSNQVNGIAHDAIQGTWIFDISGEDKGGCIIFFDDSNNTFQGYGVSEKFNLFRIEGNYTLDEDENIDGAFSFYEFNNTGMMLETVKMTGVVDSKYSKVTFKTDSSDGSPISLAFKGLWKPQEEVLENLNLPEKWTAKITGETKGALDSFEIKPFELDGDFYPHLFMISGNRFVGEGAVWVEGVFFLTGKDMVYGIYWIINGISETGFFSGKLKPTSENFTFKFVSDNGNKYTFKGEVNP